MLMPDALEKAYAVFLDDPLIFARQIAPSKFNVPFPIYAKTIADEIMFPDKKYALTQFIANRGGGKSMLVNTAMPLHQGLHGNIKHMILLTFSQEKQKDPLEHIRAVIKGEDFKGYYGDCIERDVGNEIYIKNDRLKCHFLILANSKGIPLEGKNKDIGGESIRPQKIFGDDLEVEKTAFSEVHINAIINMYWKSLYFGLDKTHGVRSHMFNVGTLFYTNGALTRLGNDPKTKTLIFPAIILDDAGDQKVMEWCKREYGLSEGDSLWPEVWPSADLLREWEIWKQTAQGRKAWESQRLMHITSNSATRFDTSKLKKFDWKEIDMHSLSFYFFCDASYKTAATNDDLGISLIGLDRLGNKYWFELVDGKFNYRSFIDKIVEIYDRFNLREYGLTSIGIESIAFQFFEQAYFDSMGTSGINVPLYELFPKNIPKAVRISRMIPDMNYGKIYAEKNIHEYMKSKLELFDADGPPNPKNLNSIDSGCYVYYNSVGASAKEDRQIPTGYDSPQNIAAWTEIHERLVAETMLGENFIPAIKKQLETNYDYYENMFMWNRGVEVVSVDSIEY